MSLKERLQVVPAVGVLVARGGVDGEREVLLHKRQNTGFNDDTWDAPSGHIESQPNGLIETPVAAAARELMEEARLVVAHADLRLVNLATCVEPAVNYQYFTYVTEWDGSEPTIGEPEKCSELGWFALEALPDDVNFITQHVVQAHLAQPDTISYTAFTLPQ